MLLMFIFIYIGFYGCNTSWVVLSYLGPTDFILYPQKSSQQSDTNKKHGFMCNIFLFLTIIKLLYNYECIEKCYEFVYIMSSFNHVRLGTNIHIYSAANISICVINVTCYFSMYLLNHSVFGHIDLVIHLSDCTLGIK